MPQINPIKIEYALKSEYFETNLYGLKIASLAQYNAQRRKA
jgi:hypothetical protein